MPLVQQILGGIEETQIVQEAPAGRIVRQLLRYAVAQGQQFGDISCSHGLTSPK